MQASEPLRIGIVGTGFGQQTARVFQAHERTIVTAICGKDPDRTAEVAAELAIPYTFTDYHEMISAAPIDAVAVVTPPHIHRPVAEAAMSRGKHVLCAKPLAESVESARAMRDLGASSGIVHGIDQQFRTMPATHLSQGLARRGSSRTTPLRCGASSDRCLGILRVSWREPVKGDMVHRANGRRLPARPELGLGPSIVVVRTRACREWFCAHCNSRKQRLPTVTACEQKHPTPRTRMSSSGAA